MSDYAFDIAVREHTVKTSRHTTFYLEAGPASGTPVIFCHGFPELAISWRHQLPALASAGFRAIAPDMRGYGRSTVHKSHEDYALEQAVKDMIELVDQLGIERAVWVGHDWGAATVWSIASHHPERCHGVASLCVPYGGLERGLEAMLPYVDRNVYPKDQFPAGQWEYMRFIEKNPGRTTEVWEVDPRKTFKTLYRRGDPAGHLKPTFTAFVWRDGGYYGGADEAPDVDRDEWMITESDLCAYASAFERTGFFGADSWYMNHKRNAAYAATAKNGGRLDLPALFLHGRYDYVCETMTSRLAEPMRELCTNLTERVVDSAHWMTQEQPHAVNAHLLRWIANNLTDVWPKG